MIENLKQVNDYLTKSNLPASDYVINPYVGCPHACKYCYARFMKRFTNHQEEWGEFIDIKLCEKPVAIHRLAGKSLFLSSVTDCYNQYEEKYQITRKILEQLVDADCSVTISTKSGLILRDIDLLSRFRDLKVAVSVNTMDEGFRSDMDRAGSIRERLDTLKALHERGIETILFMSPIFPYITDFREIIEASENFTDVYWFENLNLRGAYKNVILTYIKEKYPQYETAYRQIYQKKDMSYWEGLAREIAGYCGEKHLKYENYFYHKMLVEAKKEEARQK